MSSQPHRIAFVGTDRQVHLVGAGGEGERQITLSVADNPLLRWGRPGVSPTIASWPTWSPDGRRVACFQAPGGQDVSGPASVQVLEVDGPRQYELFSAAGRVPVHACWRPDADGLALLLQAEDRLELGYCPVEALGQFRLIEEGATIFYSWAGDGRSILVHARGSLSASGGRLVLRDTAGQLPDAVLDGPEGAYCTPVVVGERVVHVVARGEANILVSEHLDGGARAELVEFSGLGTVVPAPELDAVIFAAAPGGGHGHPYRGATLVPLAGGPRTRLTEHDTIALFWSGARKRLVYAVPLPEQRLLAWYTVRPGEAPSALVRVRPTRESLFRMHFFEQLAFSHPPLSADGRYLVVCGHLEGEDPAGLPPRIHVVDLAEPREPLAVGSGLFGCFSA